MRIAIISDIHSNLEGLTKALEIIGQKSVDEIICLGDIIGYGANPNECMDIVIEHCNVILRGNHEDAVANPDLTNYFTDNARSAIEWTRRELTDKNYDFISSLPISCEKHDFLFVHSSPCNPEKWEYLVSSYKAVIAFNCFKNSICFIGHTHSPAIYSLSGRADDILKDNRYIINVGSVGQPRDRNPELSFGIFDTDAWTYENVRSAYDFQTAAKKILATDLPSQLGHRLFFGV